MGQATAALNTVGRASCDPEHGGTMTNCGSERGGPWQAAAPMGHGRAMTAFRHAWGLLVLVSTACAHEPAFGPRAHTRREASLAAAAKFDQHLWRDTSTFRPDGALVAYVEIPTGVRDKFEYRMETNTRIVDRVLPADVGGYPVNYGMIPQTLAYDGDPLDVLVLGGPLQGGALVDVTIVGLMDMDDEKGPDPKVVAAPRGPDGAPAITLTPKTKAALTRWFNGYKRFDTDKGKWARVTGWRNSAAAKDLIARCRGFFAAGS